MKQFNDVYLGTRAAITGHTGFKGSWLASWLVQLGAEICGISLDPETRPCHWDELDLEIDDHRMDIADAAKVMQVLSVFQPDIVFHLAAQPLVRQSYQAPVDTWTTNVMGAAHVLEACRQIESVRALVVVTTDKVYAYNESARGYRENDRLGGYDPYSASKAATELLIDSYRNAFSSVTGTPLIASVRAGNVIGGGDWSRDRLIPDLIRSIYQDEKLTIRSPHATRPWQHVLECLSGYLFLGQRLLEAKSEFAEAWNFGPTRQGNRSVTEILTLLQDSWSALRWCVSEDVQVHEATLLCLDHSKAKTKLGWKPIWDLEQTLKVTANWYREFHENGKLLTHKQLSGYVNDACSAGALWLG